jgi:hypothetical protein
MRIQTLINFQKKMKFWNTNVWRKIIIEFTVNLILKLFILYEVKSLYN